MARCSKCKQKKTPLHKRFGGVLCDDCLKVYQELTGKE